MRFFKLIPLMLIGFAAQAGNLGQVGPTYPVGEESALTMIMNKLQQKEQSGELQALEKIAVQRAINSATHREPVAGVGTVVMRRQHLVDPTVTYEQALTTDMGEIVIPAGTTINPLRIMNLSKRLVFFDGRDTEQVAAVQRMVSSGSTIKPILIAGSWLELTRSWKQQVYFDQKGVLSKRFGIRAVPTVISQQGDMLLSQEVPAKELQ